MSRADPGRYRPGYGRNPCRADDCAGVTDMAERIKALEADLRERDWQVRSLNAEVRRLQRLVPRELIKGQRRPTRAEKEAMSHANPG